MAEQRGFDGRDIGEQYAREERTRRNILEILERRTEGPVQMLEVSSSLPPEGGKMNYNDDCLSLLENVVRDRKLLDLFAGSQSTRSFFDERDTHTTVTSVDITPGRADYTVSVADIAQHIEPEKQFACVLALGAHPGFMNFSDIERFLEDDGYFVTGGDSEMFEKFEKSFFSQGGQASPDELQSPYTQDLERASHYFHPVLIVKVNDIRGWYQEYFKEKGIVARVDKTYVFWRKGGMSSSTEMPF